MAGSDRDGNLSQMMSMRTRNSNNERGNVNQYEMEATYKKAYQQLMKEKWKNY